MQTNRHGVFRVIVGVALGGAATTAQACATCFGRSDSALAEGMNWGILTLLVVLAGVLASFLSFVVYLARRADATADTATAPGRTVAEENR